MMYSMAAEPTILDCSFLLTVYNGQLRLQRRPGRTNSNYNSHDYNDVHNSNNTNICESEYHNKQEPVPSLETYFLDLEEWGDVGRKGEPLVLRLGKRLGLWRQECFRPSPRIQQLTP